MTKVLVVKPGTLVVADKRKLRNAGVVAVEAEHPEDVRLLSTEGPPLSGDEMLFAAVSACQITQWSREELGRQMMAAIERTRASLTPTEEKPE